MDANVIAVNPTLGAIAVELEDKSCLVLETSSRFRLSIGDTVNADWDSTEMLTVKNSETGKEFTASIQKETDNRSDAISAISII